MSLNVTEKHDFNGCFLVSPTDRCPVTRVTLGVKFYFIFPLCLAALTPRALRRIWLTCVRRGVGWAWEPGAALAGRPRRLAGRLRSLSRVRGPSAARRPGHSPSFPPPSPTATGTAVPPAARTPRTAPPPTWASAAPPTTCPPRPDRRGSPRPRPGPGGFTPARPPARRPEPPRVGASEAHRSMLRRVF